MTRTHNDSTINCQKEMTVKSGETPLGYNTMSQSHTCHKPKFIYVTANKKVFSKIATLEL